MNVVKWQNKFPKAFSELKRILEKTIRNQPKGYCLVKRPSKTYGFLYYVRYIKDGKEVPSKWNTHTNILEDAERFARENRARILSEYYTRHTPQGELFSILETYYTKNSSYLITDQNRNRIIGEKTRSVYYHFITKVLIPFLKMEKVKAFSDITPPLIVRFQNHLLAKGNRPQTVNRYLGCVRSIFNHLLMTGVIHESAFDKIRMLKTGAKTNTVRGCYELDAVTGVFNIPWEDKLKYLLCLIIYTTGLRNSEIERIQAKDLVNIEDCRFINVKKSKTENGIRMIPLHNFVYEQILIYLKETGKKPDDYIFSSHGGPNQSTLYKASNILLSKKLGEKREYLEEQKITFYSGRHFWKTLMNAEGLGEDIEEYFMGHKVYGDVSKRYNHKDKRGQKRLLEKARDVFTILDKKLFAPSGKPTG
ncbi:MAG: site-specific integrase [Treponema sp.]|nr:site-specific integrase [Treponema sp.]